MGTDFTRRGFVRLAGIGTGIALTHTLLPLRLVHAATPTDRRLLVVILRGALDGLAAVVPYGDRAYVAARGNMALPQNADTLVDLDGFFALHAALKPLLPLYQGRELLISHATASPYRDRSHFDAQDLLENGGEKPHGLTTGWLNRALSAMPATSSQSSTRVMAIGSSVPLLLRGEIRVGSWAPSVLPNVDDSFLARVARMYHADPLLRDALASAQQMQGIDNGMNNGPRGPRAFVGLMENAARLMVPGDGARIASVDIGGWDTHANQGLESGRLANNLMVLAEGLLAFRQGMGAAWKDTAVLCITEFGRTVAGNGSRGTDHGTASVALLLGGSVKGGRVVGEWPGLSKLHEGRDLVPANDLRGLLKATLKQQLHLTPDILDTHVFPGSSKTQLNEPLFLNA